jgi:hypothetical protein
VISCLPLAKKKCAGLYGFGRRNLRAASVISTCRVNLLRVELKTAFAGQDNTYQHIFRTRYKQILASLCGIQAGWG